MISNAILDQLSTLIGSKVMLRDDTTEVPVLPALVDEIKRLRAALEDVEAERIAATTQSLAHELSAKAWQERAGRAERILDALREPSEAVVDATHDSLLETDDWSSAIRAAVEAAEKEIDNE